MKNITSVLQKVYENEELRKTIVPLFLGNPGLGKTKLIEQFAKEKGVKLVEFITSQMSPFEISGIAMPDKDLKQMIYYNFDKLDSLVDGDILFFDELLNGNPTVLAACLTILENRRMISGEELPNIMIIAAANEQGMSPTTPQIKERFVWYSVKFDPDMFKKYIMEKYMLTTKQATSLVKLIKEEDFTGKNFDTPRSLDKAISMMIVECPTPYEEKLMPILNLPIKNITKKNIKLPNGESFAPNEMMPWLTLVKHMKNEII